MSVDYGPCGRIGIAVPHANPTVEPELRCLVPSALGVYATRLTHPSPDVTERITYYIRHIPDAIRSFGSMAGLKAFGFGCTGSSYMVSPAEEDQLTAAAARYWELARMWSAPLSASIGAAPIACLRAPPGQRTIACH